MSPTHQSRVKRVIAHGFRQGTTAERNDGNCTTCEKRIQTVRSWWIDGGGECDDGWNGHCLACAEKRVASDETMWADYATARVEEEW